MTTNITSHMILCTFINYHILRRFPYMRIRKDAVPDLHTPPRRAAAP
ncbi:hypothetical protein OY10_004571 [Salmonella enterica subsp. enterica serovar Havana]|nr:hypothetical protein [Salmonella enterica subsp. enterica serovar Havana]EDV6712210.1 hypothetical protein [Salmonella enterica subsp. enterica serovar Havana]